MHDAGRVGPAEPGGHLRGELQQLLDGQRTWPDKDAKRLAFEELHDEHVAAGGTPGAGDFLE